MQWWAWREHAWGRSSPEEGYLDGSALRLVLLVAGNEVVDEGEADVEDEDDGRGQQGPQVKGHTLLQRTGRT